MILTWMNFISFCLLALTGAGLALAARRVHRVVKQTERRLSATVDEKNAIAAELRLARREEAAIRQALEEAEGAIQQMTQAGEAAEARIEQLKTQPKLVLNMVDQEWRRFDRLWQVPVMNPTLPSAIMRLPGGNAGDQARLVYGFARSSAEFRSRVEARFKPSSGFIIGDADMVDLERIGAAGGAG